MLRFLNSLASPPTQWDHTLYRKQTASFPVSLKKSNYPLIESPFSKENATCKTRTSVAQMLHRAVVRDLRRQQEEETRKKQEVKEAMPIFLSLMGFNAAAEPPKPLDQTRTQQEKSRLQEIQDDLFQNPILPKLKDLLHPTTKQEALEYLQEFKQKINEAFELSGLLGIPADSDESLGVINRSILISVAFLLLITEEKTDRDGQPCFGGMVLLNNLFEHGFITPDETIQNLSLYFNRFSPELRSQVLELVKNVISSPLSTNYTQHIYALCEDKQTPPVISQLCREIQVNVHEVALVRPLRTHPKVKAAWTNRKLMPI